MSMDPQLAPVRPGEVVAGRYRIERVIGVGGMGIVVAAMHLQLEQRVALKFLLPHALESAVVMARFTREARAAVRIKSEHIARIMDVGTLDSGTPYMVMEYLEGSDLAAVLRARGRLAIEEAVDYILQACEAIAEAHRLGIVHRDLKPANLFLARGDGVENIKVLDFGISKMSSLSASSEAASMTHTGVLLGSPMYMSPEQLTSPREVDSGTDIWSLGVVLHQLLAGEPPFNGTTVTQISIAVVQHPAPLLEQLRTDVPPGLAAAVRRCLEKSRVDRFANVEELAAALAVFAPARSRASIERIQRPASAQVASSSTSVGELDADFVDVPLDDSLLSAAPTATDSATQGEWVGTPIRRRGRPHLRMALGGLGLVTVTVGAWLLAARARPAGPAVLIAHEIGSSPETLPKLVARPETTADPAALPGAAISAPSASLSAALPSASSAASLRTARPVVRRTAPVRAAPSAVSRTRSPTTNGWEDER